MLPFKIPMLRARIPTSWICQLFVTYGTVMTAEAAGALPKANMSQTRRASQYMTRNIVCLEDTPWKGEFHREWSTCWTRLLVWATMRENARLLGWKNSYSRISIPRPANPMPPKLQHPITNALLLASWPLWTGSGYVNKVLGNSVDIT